MENFNQQARPKICIIFNEGATILSILMNKRLVVIMEDGLAMVHFCIVNL
jgi:hypothetical protein